MNTRTSRYKLFEYVIVQTDPETERSTRIQFCLTYVPQAIAYISFFVILISCAVTNAKLMLK